MTGFSFEAKAVVASARRRVRAVEGRSFMIGIGIGQTEGGENENESEGETERRFTTEGES
jgi:hypothetical protein